MFLRCSRCGKSYRGERVERDDPTRLCARCYMDTHQPPMHLFDIPAPARPIHTRAGFTPAARAAGDFQDKE